MFEKEVNTILEKEKNSIELINKLNEIYKPYCFNGSNKNTISSCVYMRLTSVEEVKRYTKEDLNRIVRKHGLITGLSHNAEIEQIAEYIKNINIDNFYYSLAYSFAISRRYYNYEFNNNLFTCTDVHESKLLQILNCIWLLTNSEPIKGDLFNKIYGLAENGKTFIFDGCKVTRYKNQNLKIEFANKEKFEQFKNRFNKALDKAKEEIKKNNC